MNRPEIACTFSGELPPLWHLPIFLFLRKSVRYFGKMSKWFIQDGKNTIFMGSKTCWCLKTSEKRSWSLRARFRNALE